MSITSSAPPNTCLTMEEFKRLRGYDTDSRRYAPDEVPDGSGRQLHKLSY